jgi:hypothetical protein
MTDHDRLPLLRRVLRALGLSPAAADDIVERVLELLSGKEEPQRHRSSPTTCVTISSQRRS